MKTHKELVEIGYRWIQRSKQRNTLGCYVGCSVAFKELVTHAQEQPDVIGFNSYNSILIECKATRSDFLSDKNKPFREHPETGMGEYRFYLTNKDLVKPEEVPEKWGLLESCGRSVRIIKDPTKYDDFAYRSERQYMRSIIRRICCLDMIDVINDARFKQSVYEWDTDLLNQQA